MRIPIVCAKCGNDFSAPESFVGRKVVCPSCGKGTRVPKTAGGTESGTKVRAVSRRNPGGGAQGLKYGAMIILGVSVVVALAMGWEKLPSLAQLNLASMQNAAPSSLDTNPTSPPVVENPVKPEAPPAVTSPQEDKPPPRVEPNPSRQPKATPKPTPRPGREQAAEEFDSERGRELFAKIKRVSLVRGWKEANPPNPKNNKNKVQDPRAALWTEAVANGRHVIEKLGLEATVGNAGPDATALTITIDLKPSTKGTPGTKEISMTAVLTCVDPAAQSGSTKYAKVWKAEQDLGTISAKSSKTGKLPNSVEEQMTKFFGKFRSAYNHAVHATKTPGDAEPGA